MRFLLVDDHPLVRESLRLLLLNLYRDCTVTEAATAKEAVTRIAKETWDVAFLDVGLPDRSGLDLMRDIQAMAPDLPVIILSGMSENEFGWQALRAGAWGFLPKACSMTEIQAAIRSVLAGRKYITPNLATKLAELSMRPASNLPHYGLSQREFEVLRLFGSGCTASDAAAKLNLSIKTVSTYRARLLEKLGLKTTGDLVRYAVTHQLAE